MPLINCEIRLILIWFARYFIVDGPIAGQEPKFTITDTGKESAFTITDTKLYVSAVTFSTQDNAKLLKQLKSGFKRTIKWNKYHRKVTVQQQNQCLEFLIT